MRTEAEPIRALIMVRGNAFLGMTTRDADGNVVEKQAPRFEYDPKGGTVAVTEIDPETMEVREPVEIFGDWDAAGYLGRALKIMQPSRQVNAPDLREIIREAAANGDKRLLCDYCKAARSCPDCIITDWVLEWEEEQEAMI